MANAFEQFGYEGDPLPSVAGGASLSSGNRFSQFGYDDGTPSKPPVEAMPSRGPVSDIVQNAGGGIVRGAAATVGMPGSVQDSWNRIWDRVALGAAHKAMDWTGYGPQAGTKDREDFDNAYHAMGGEGVGGDIVRASGLPNPSSLPTGGDVTAGIEKVAGPLPTPQTRAGEYAETIGEFLPAAIGAPGGFVRKSIETAVPAVASETAGQLAKGSPYEKDADLIRMAAAMGAGGGMAGLEGAASKVQGYRAPMDKLGGLQRSIELPGGSIAFDTAGQPITATKSQAALAGGFLRDAATDPAAVQRNLEGGVQEIVPGSRPTTFQQTGDMGLGQLERGVAARNGDLFKQRAADQNAARVTHIQSIQPDGSPADLANSFRAVRDAMDADHAQSLASAHQAAQDAGRNIGGVGATPESVGAGLRDPVVAARAAA